MLGGYFGRYLAVDLTAGKLLDVPIPDDWFQLHLGAKGLAARVLAETLDLGCPPLGAGNALVFATGPFQGTGLAGAGRHVVMAKSPRTCCPADSYAGGTFGHHLGRSGYDAVVITGRSEQPTYLTLARGKARIHGAADLWGKTTGETTDVLLQRHGSGSVSCIGPAGEKLSMLACIINDYNRSAGRPGFGAVLGSKNLKAVFVQGTRAKKLFDAPGFRSVASAWARAASGDESLQSLGTYGTDGALSPLNEMGTLPTRNFRDGWFERAVDIDGEALVASALVRRDTCTGCPVRCKRVAGGTVNGDRLDERYGGPEYETTAAFGSLCMISDLKAICLANNKCNAYGLDTIGTGSAIAFAMEASERGLLQNGPAWGSPEDMLAWIDKIALRQGPGDMLAQGVVNAARQLGCEDLGVHIKGVEVPMHEPRGKKSLAISYATSPRGANHMETVHDDAWSHLDTLPAELRIVPHSDRFALDEHKAHICKRFTDLVSFANSLVLCAFYTFDCNWGGEYRLPQVRELLHAATGMRLDAEDMFTIGERNYVLLKHLAFESGYTRQDDDLPHRLKQPLGKGNSAGQTIDSTLLHHVIDTYYSIRGYLPGGGVSREKLAELSLSGLPRRSANHAARSKEE